MKEIIKHRLLVGTIILSLVPAALLMNIPSAFEYQAVAMWLSAVFGYWGIVLLLWMYVLGAKSVMSMVFKDLASVLSIHKWLGKYGSAAILLHPLLIVLGYGESLLYIVLPELGMEFGRHVTLGRLAFLLVLITWFLSYFFRKKLGFRPWKYIHYLAYICVPFVLLHVPDIGSNIISSASVWAYFWLLVIVFILFSWLRLRGFLNLDKCRYDIVGVDQLTSIDYKIRLKPASGAIRPPKRGQYVYLKLGIISEDHPFSVVGYDEMTKEISIAYRLLGSFTKELAKLSVGHDVWVGGPYGSFMSDLSTDSNQPSVYISGGIGITPFVERMARENGAREQWLFACNRTHEVAVFVDWLRDIASNRVVSILSDDPNTRDEQGYFSAEILQRYLTNPQKYHYYFCGPPAMKEPVYAELAKLGIPENQIESEKFGW